MKSIVACILLATALVCHAQEAGSHYAKIDKIKASIQETPVFAFRGPDDQRVESRRWLQIDAELELATNEPSGIVPQLDAQWFVVIKDAATDKSVKLTGTVIYKDVRATMIKVPDGKKHATPTSKVLRLSAYVSPDTLQKITWKPSIKESDIEAVALVISGPSVSGKPENLQKASAQQETQWWNKDLNPVKEGAVIAKSKTPFAALWTDLYPTDEMPSKS